MASVEAIFQGAEAQRYIDRLVAKTGSLKRGSKALGGILSATVFRGIISNFEKERGPDGTWKDWSSAYRSYMEKRGKGGNKKLQDSGRLRQSLMPGAGNYRTSSQGITFYSTVKYAHRHDEGTDGMPKRKFMWLSEEYMESIAKQTLRWLDDEDAEK